MSHALAIRAARPTAEFFEDRNIRVALACSTILFQPPNELTRTKVTQVSTSLSTLSREQRKPICHHPLKTVVELATTR
jgi:hypothetical protein